MSTDQDGGSPAGASPGGKRGRPDAKAKPKARARLLIPAVLTGVALALGAVSFWLYLYASPTESAAPPYATITVVSNSRIGIIGYAVDQVNASLARLQIWVELSNVPLTSTPVGSLTISRPNATPFLRCPKPVCADILGGGSSLMPTQPQPLTFRPYPGLQSLVAFANFTVAAHDFGYAFNGVTASAALPQVFYQGRGMPTLETEYYIPSASSYDWSLVPTEFANGTRAWWDETISGGGVPGRIAAGVDLASQQTDSNLTFAAGALTGLAGGALLWAVQEAFRPRNPAT